MIAELKTAMGKRQGVHEIDRPPTAADRVKIKVERHALLLRGAPTAICVSAVLAAITFVLGSMRIEPAIIGSWAAAVIGLAMVRILVWRHYSKKKHLAHGIFSFTRIHVAAMAVNGALWGALAPIFSVYGLIGYAFLPFLIAGMSAATVSSAGASWRSVLAFNIPALTPLAITYAVTGGPEGLAIAGVVGLYVAATAYLAYTTQKMIERSIRLRSRNDNLMRALTAKIDATHEAEQRYRALVESSKDVTIIFSPEGLVRYASPSVIKVLGAQPEDFIGMTTKQIVHPDDFPVFKAVGERSLSNIGEVIPLSHVCLRGPGQDYVPLAGRLTNMLYVPGVEGFVFNGGVIGGGLQHSHAAE
ncbi:MAG: PAS domain-containing protein [Pseudomonadota bacterium]